jgi:hypothetical protein
VSEDELGIATSKTRIGCLRSAPFCACLNAWLKTGIGPRRFNHRGVDASDEESDMTQPKTFLVSAAAIALT